MARIAAEAGAALLARGAGTSLAGQTCNEAVVVDMSRHMSRIVDIDPERRTAKVEPGVVLDDLRRAAERRGLTFGPDPATHAWCTLGGMIGNNSCGTHGLYAGKTSDNVERLRVVLAGGEELEVGAYAPEAREAAVAGGGRLGKLLAGLSDLSARYGPWWRHASPSSLAGLAGSTWTSSPRRAGSMWPVRWWVRNRRALSRQRRPCGWSQAPNNGLLSYWVTLTSLPPRRPCQGCWPTLCSLSRASTAPL